MFAFRRAAARAIASPVLSTPLRSQPQSIRTYSLAISRCRQTTSPVSSAFALQRRWASDESTPAETRNEPVADDTIEHSESAIPEHTERSVEGVTGTEEGSSIADAVKSAADTTQAAVDSSNAPATVKDTVAVATGAAANAATGHSDPPTVFVGNLFFHVDEAKLTEEFSKWGDVSRASIARDSRGMSKGFGFIEYRTQEECNNAIESGHNQLFDGRIMSVQARTKKSSTNQRRDGRPRSRDLQANSGPVNPPSRTLFVGNMSYDMSDTDLNNLFRPLKNVLDVRVAIDRRTGQARGFAHADFMDVASASEGLEYLSSQVVYGRKLRVDYGVSYKKPEESQSQSQSQ